MVETKLHVTTPSQLPLDLAVAVEHERDGVGMGVLSDGTAYLTGRGLARLCGVDHANVVRIAEEWLVTPQKPRETRIRQLVREQSADDTIAFFAIWRGTIFSHHAFPPAVCMAVLEYYAFEAKGGNSEKAASNYRTLARKGFQEFIYSQVGYNPTKSVNKAWTQFHDRVTLNYHKVPPGYFSIFKELADITVTLIRQGADLGPSFVPDISVGSHWGKYWTTNDLDSVHGPRKRYAHSYPSYFAQAASNPQDAHCYPDEALPEFREWVRNEYLPKHLPSYLSGKVRTGAIAALSATKAIEALRPNIAIAKQPTS